MMYRQVSGVSEYYKCVRDAEKHLITVPLTRGFSFPHRYEGIFGAAKVMLRPAAEGTGVIAGLFGSFQIPPPVALPFFFPFFSCAFLLLEHLWNRKIMLQPNCPRRALSSWQVRGSFQALLAAAVCVWSTVLSFLPRPIWLGEAFEGYVA
jgi:hypothetical protein